MAKQTINIGSTANDRTGSTLRAAIDICNDNFDELYGYVTIPVSDTDGIMDDQNEVIAAVGTAASVGAGWHKLVKTTYNDVTKKHYILYSSGVNFYRVELTTI